jgi:two-component system, cell cycle response regulator CpdR
MEEPFTVLFVEDDDGVRESVAELLAARGFRMLVAHDAREALRLLAENRVDALFTDIVMPGIDGVDLARQARRLHPELKVLFMTGYSARAPEAMTLAKLLYKPLRSAEIEVELRMLLASA